MRLFALIAVPVLGAVGAYAHRAAAWRTAWLVSIGGLHAGLCLWLWFEPVPPAFDGWIAADSPGLLVLTLVSLLFLVMSFYAVGFLRHESPRGGRAFVSCLLLFLAAASMVALSQHLAMLWVGMEATTLAVAPLIYHRHDRRSLEAVWKYLVLSSVGIGLALLGTFFLAAAQPGGRPLVLPDLLTGASTLQPSLLRAAFIFLLVGYGTKMGLAPLHTWKPDTYGEAPSVVAGLMAGGLTSCAFLGVVRITQVSNAAGLTGFTQPILIAFGLFSLVVAAAFLIGQTDLKRMLAYSSVEHMGILVLGLGLGGAGNYGSMLHVLNNGLTKGLMFLTVGNVMLASGKAETVSPHGIARRVPLSGALLLVGLFAVTGSPPFGTFVSEFTILGAALHQGHPWVAATTLALLAVIFVGMAGLVLEWVYGGDQEPRPRLRENPIRLIGPLLLAALVLMLGVFIPSPLQRVLRAAAEALGGNAP
jgi:hydrogenase-4 component F